MNWDILPLIGLGSLMIGMKPAQVASILDPLGPISRVIQDDDSSFSESRSLTLPFVSYREGKVCSIDTRPFIKKVLYKGIDVFDHDPSTVVRTLQTDNKGLRYAIGSYMFSNLGILLNGYANPESNGASVFDENDDSYDPDERSLTIWSSGAFDSFMDNFAVIPDL